MSPAMDATTSSTKTGILLREVRSSSVTGGRVTADCPRNSWYIISASRLFYAVKRRDGNHKSGEVMLRLYEFLTRGYLVGWVPIANSLGSPCCRRFLLPTLFPMRTPIFLGYQKQISSKRRARLLL